MKASYSNFVQSRFFNPAFNSAIFDGPVRIYFAQFHESLALKIYFLLQHKFASEMATAKELSRRDDRVLMVMLYPSVESFQMSFDADPPGFLHHDFFNENPLIATKGPCNDENIFMVANEISRILKIWAESLPLDPQLPELEWN